MKNRSFEATLATKENGLFDPNSAEYSNYIIDSCSNMTEAMEVAEELLRTLNTANPEKGWFVWSIDGLRGK